MRFCEGSESIHKIDQDHKGLHNFSEGFQINMNRSEPSLFIQLSLLETRESSDFPLDVFWKNFAQN